MLASNSDAKCRDRKCRTAVRVPFKQPDPQIEGAGPMEFNAGSGQKHLPCQPSTSKISFTTYKNKDDEDDDEIQIDDDEYAGTEMEDEEEDKEFRPNEADMSSDDSINADQHDSAHHKSICGSQWQQNNADPVMLADNLKPIESNSFWGAEKLTEFSNEELSISASLHRELRNLSFRNPGNRCTLPVPLRAKRTVVISAKQSKGFDEPSADRRSMRKRTARKEVLCSDGQILAKSKLRYNNKGRLVIPGRTEMDLCDCLDSKCNGCQYQCKKCGGNKCSYACRSNRTTFIEQIDTLGGGRTQSVFAMDDAK